MDPNEQTTSPVPGETVPAEVHLSFYDALKKLAEGSRITRLEWGSKDIYGELVDGRVKINLESGLKDWVISDGDLEGTDWVVV